MTDNNQQKPKGFNRAKRKAEEVLANEEKIEKLLEEGFKKADEKENELKEVWNDIQLLLRLIKSWWKKEYTAVPWKTIIYAATAIFYLINPLDIIPDFIPIIGFVDDITVIGFVINSLQKDIIKFKDWENQQHTKEQSEHPQ